MTTSPSTSTTRSRASTYLLGPFPPSSCLPAGRTELGGVAHTTSQNDKDRAEQEVRGRPHTLDPQRKHSHLRLQELVGRYRDGAHLRHRSTTHNTHTPLHASALTLLITLCSLLCLLLPAQRPCGISRYTTITICDTSRAIATGNPATGPLVTTSCIACALGPDRYLCCDLICLWLVVC